MSDISEKLQTAMENKKTSYGELSEATGIPKSALHRYINGDTEKVPIERIKIISAALGISAAYVMGWEKPTTVSDDGLDPAHLELLKSLSKADLDIVLSVARQMKQRETQSDQ